MSLKIDKAANKQIQEIVIIIIFVPSKIDTVSVCFILNSGCSLVRLKCASGGRESGGSNPLTPTKLFCDSKTQGLNHEDQIHLNPKDFVLAEMSAANEKL